MQTYTPESLRRHAVMAGAALHGWLSLFFLLIATWGGDGFHRLGVFWWGLSLLWFYWPVHILRKRRKKPEIIALLFGSIPMIVVLPATISFLLQIVGAHAGSPVHFR